ncbi:hypothetical protein [Mangrovimonas cancribranchiae]|uniref:YhhN-like protein n=1 Tax=Mangrovimonas cancribranchiae TaxID=3080055 RepID=A0AAU6NZ50_9FLAO
MINWLKSSYNTFSLCVIVTILLLNVFALLNSNDTILRFFKPLLIPAFLMYLFIKNNYVNKALIIFFVFSFLGDSISALYNGSQAIKYANLSYFISYLSLMVLVLSKLKSIKLDKIIGVYLFVVFFINSYFLYELFLILKANITDIAEVNLFVLKSVSLTILSLVSFVVYLTKDTKQSIIFLVMALCFVFSDVLFYITNYYIYNWSFAVLERVLHVFGIFFLFGYVVSENRIKVKQKQESYNEITLRENALT